MSRQDIIQNIKKTLERVAPGAEVILYGSEARGDAQANSDIDVLVLINKNKDKLSFKEITKITYPLYDIEIETGVVISPLVYTHKQWEKRPFKTPFYINVMNEGVVL